MGSLENKLSATEVLLLDCQTTGASPDKGHLLEVAWCRTSAETLVTDGSPLVESRLVALPPGAAIPRPITRLTGIKPKDLDEAVEPGVLWRALCDEARATRSDGNLPALSVAHYARFEEAFLRRLHETNGEGGPFPLELCCTVEIARRLLPDLPRRGLRALAGYLGHVMGPLKRAGAHVEATAVVWAELVGRLEQRSILSWEDLCAFSKSPVPPKPKRPTFPLSREERLGLPDSPGVYRMVAREGTVLYVGKATSLKKRFNSYFQKRKHDKEERVLELLTQARTVETTGTGSPLEAALLETDEIKRLAPPYNKALQERDGRSWFRSTNLAGRTAEVDDAHPVGPLPRRESLEALAQVCLWLRPAGVPARTRKRDFCRALGVPEVAGIDPRVARRGFDLFVLRNDLVPSKADETTVLLRLGARLWRVALQESVEVSEEEPAEEESRRLRDWTAEDVADLFDGVVRQGAQLIRRAHLLCQLSECCLSFEPRGVSDRRLLTFERGALTGAETLAAEEDLIPPVPPGHSRTWRARQRVFDEATYDRLRVLTTELRRLLAEERAVSVRFGPRAFLDAKGLSRRLAMI